MSNLNQRAEQAGNDFVQKLHADQREIFDQLGWARVGILRSYFLTAVIEKNVKNANIENVRNTFKENHLHNILGDEKAEAVVSVANAILALYLDREQMLKASAMAEANQSIPAEPILAAAEDIKDTPKNDDAAQKAALRTKIAIEYQKLAQKGDRAGQLAMFALLPLQNIKKMVAKSGESLTDSLVALFSADLEARLTNNNQVISQAEKNELVEIARNILSLVVEAAGFDPNAIQSVTSEAAMLAPANLPATPEPKFDEKEEDQANSPQVHADNDDEKKLGAQEEVPPLESDSELDAHVRQDDQAKPQSESDEKESDDEEEISASFKARGSVSGSAFNFHMRKPSHAGPESDFAQEEFAAIAANKAKQGQTGSDSDEKGTEPFLPTLVAEEELAFVFKNKLIPLMVIIPPLETTKPGLFAIRDRNKTPAEMQIKTQAKVILDRMLADYKKAELLAKKTGSAFIPPRFNITVSANDQQATIMRAANQSFNGMLQEELRGKGQAKIVNEIYRLLKKDNSFAYTNEYLCLRGLVCARPVRTCFRRESLKSGIAQLGSNQEMMVISDVLGQVEVLGRGEYLYGWQNQHSGEHGFAIGGGTGAAEFNQGEINYYQKLVAPVLKWSAGKELNAQEKKQLCTLFTDGTGRKATLASQVVQTYKHAEATMEAALEVSYKR